MIQAKAFTLWLILFVSLHITGQALANEEEHVKNPEVGIHGMLVLGSEDHTYMSHLPMYVVPHRFQGIWMIEFDEPTQGRFREAQHMQNRGGRPLYPYYTLAPTEQFALRELMKSKSSFHGTLYGGHFERQGEVIAENVKVTITHVVHWKELDPMEERPDMAQYVALGSSSELFLAHVISAPENYDQFIRVQAHENTVVTDGTVIRANVGDLNQDRLKVDQQVEADALNADRGGRLTIEVPFPFTVVSQYYLEENELAENFLPSQ